MHNKTRKTVRTAEKGMLPDRASVQLMEKRALSVVAGTTGLLSVEEGAPGECASWMLTRRIKRPLARNF